jgi:CheY-like chemotaxis protein
MQPESPYFETPGLALLVIEDPDDQSLVDEIFRSRGWQVRVEHDVSGFLELLVEEQAKIIVTDDLELVELLTRAFLLETPDGPGKAGPPVFYIALTEEDVAAAQQVGADGIVQHPINPEQLLPQ